MVMTFVQTLTNFFDITSMMPHGYCLIWNSPLLWLHIISDALIAITYYSIPISMLYFIWRHKSFPYKNLLLMFVAFIIACGTTHIVSIVTIWIPIYWLEGLLKLLTGLLSLITAIAVTIVTPKILAKIERNQFLEKELEANKVVLIEAKEKAERFSTLKSQFIATMSHEIRTPMSVIIGFSEFALFEDDPKEIKAYLQDINAASTSLMGILQDILDFTKLEAGRVVIESLPFNLLDLLNTINSLFSGSAQQKTLDFVVNRDGAIPIELLGDKLRLQQVLTNLVGNAIKFTAHGTIKLELFLKKITPSDVQIMFSVTDTGIGISLEDQSKLFVEFSQVDGSQNRQYGGTGLGLAISKELVELMGGEITLVSKKGLGSTFSFILQFDINRTTSSIPYLIPLKLPFANDTLKGHVILVVDDNDLSQKLIVKILEKLGIAAKIAATGQEALEMIEQFDFDAVLMDIHMPIMNGIEATQLIHQIAKYEHLPIIALSAGATEAERNNCISCGMVGFVSKPIDVEKLYAVLALWLKPIAEF